MAAVIPVQILSLFTWQELELNVCGTRDINVDLLMENTKYQSGITDKDTVVIWMWKMLRSFSPKQREMFLRFVWGRSRLPISSAYFDQKFVVMSHPSTSELVLPASHTCFFQLELPKYNSYEIMHSKFLYAINEGIAIDTDHRAVDVDWDAPVENTEEKEQEERNDQDEDADTDLFS